MSAPPKWVEDEMIQVLVAIMGRDHQRAKDGYKRLAEHRHILIPDELLSWMGAQLP